MNRLPIVVLAIVVGAACNDAPVQPSNPPATPPPSPAEGLVVRLSVKADESDARDAVAGLSEVIVDASASTGPGPLTFAIDFGDGSAATGAMARHVYGAPGTFTVRAEAKDALGRTGSSSQQVMVKTLTGTWFHAGYNTNNHKVEIRRLEVTAQEGRTVRGTYKLSGAPDRSFTGSLTPPRNVQIVADTTTLEGVIPGRLNEAAELWTLQVRGGTINSGRLDFRPVIGEPTGPPPDADLRIRIENGLPSAILSWSRVEFDGSSSRGSDLSFVLEFDDDQASTEPRATHVVEGSFTSIKRTARLTVVDRFGRVDTAATDYNVFALEDQTKYSWWQAVDGQSYYLPLRLDLRRREGGTYSGSIQYRSTHGPCSLVLSGERDVQIVVPSLGLEFRGHLAFPAGSLFPEMILTQTGGADHGRTWTVKKAAY